MNRYLSQNVGIGQQTIQGPLVGINSISDLVSKILVFIFPLASIILLFVLMWGGYEYMTSQGNPEKVKGAQAKISSGVIGFILLVISYLAVVLIGKITGLGSGIL